MRRDEVKELHYITPIANVPSILRHGLLSHNRAKKLLHHSVAMPEIQERRARKVVPGGRPLHDYVNLYLCARNKMLFKTSSRHVELCVLRLDPAVLDLPGVIITDRNASSDYVRFAPSPEGLSIVDAELLFADYWTHPDDPILEMRHGSVKCAEVLVPELVQAHFILGAYVSCATAQQTLAAVGFSLPITIDGHLFFQ